MEAVAEPIKVAEKNSNEITNEITKVTEFKFIEEEGNRTIVWQVENRKDYDWIGIYKSSNDADDNYITWTYVKPWLSSEISKYSADVMNEHDQLEARYFNQASRSDKAVVIKRTAINETLNTRIFDNPPFAEDEFFNDRANTGVCFSGGGSRAMVLAMGQLRGLEKLDLMKNVRYISSVSGGSWASTAYAYRTNDDTKDLIGEYKDAKDITLENLKSQLPQMAMANKAMFSSFLKGAHTMEANIRLYGLSPFILNYFASLFFMYQGKIGQSQGWQNAIANSFLQPFGLLKDFQTDHFTLNDETLKEFEKQNPVFKEQENKVFTQNSNSPYLIVNGVISNIVDQVIKEKKNYIGIEFTPLYTDTGYRANDFNVPFGDQNVQIGNGAIQSLSFGGAPNSAIDGNFIKTFQASEPLGLGAITGVSSNFLGGIIATEKPAVIALMNIILFALKTMGIDKLIDNLEEKEEFPLIKILKNIIPLIAEGIDEGVLQNPQSIYWSPNSTKDEIPKYENFELSDGGCMDNYGIMPLLRRKVEKIVVFINSDMPLNMEAIPDSGKVDAKFMEPTLPSLFDGLNDHLSIRDTLGIDVSNNHVLESSGFEEVISKLQDAKKKDQTVMATTKHTTVKNDWWGIDPYDVEICWVYNEIVPNFEKELPEETQKELKIGKYRSDETTKSFPLYGTFESTLNGFLQEDAAMLGHMGAWNVANKNSKKEFEKILKA